MCVCTVHTACGPVSVSVCILLLACHMVVVVYHIAGIQENRGRNQAPSSSGLFQGHLQTHDNVLVSNNTHMYIRTHLYILVCW